MKKADKFWGQTLINTSQFIGISDDIIQQVKVEGKVASGSWENGELRYIVASPLPSANIDGIDNPMMVMIFHDLTHEYLQVLIMILFTFAIAIVFAGVIIWFISKKNNSSIKRNESGCNDTMPKVISQKRFRINQMMRLVS